MKNTVVVSLATNDEHGNDTGRISAVQIGDAIDLQWGELGGTDPRYRLEPLYIWISRRKFRYLGKQTWYGNWCWTGISMNIAEVANLLNYLSRDDRWHCEGGWCDLTDSYTQGTVTPELLADAEV